MHGLQRLMCCILPTMHYRSQHSWELLHPFARHCQHARNNSQHWRNNVGSCCVRLYVALSPVLTDATLLANNSQHCWMLHVASVCTPCCMLLDVVACCCAKFEPVKLFSQQLPTFLLFRDRWNVAQQCWIRLHRSSLQVFQHCWCHARSLRMDYKDLWVVFFPPCTAGPKFVRSCCIRLHTTANTHATTPNIVGATMLGVVAPVCTQHYGGVDFLREFVD